MKFKLILQIFIFTTILNADISLSLLKNGLLIDNASTLYSKGYNQYLAHLRAVLKADSKIKEAKKELDNFSIDNVKTFLDKNSEIFTKKEIEDNREILEQKRKYFNKVLKSYEYSIDIINKTIIEITTYDLSLKKLIFDYSLEIRLRLADNSLDIKSVPKKLYLKSLQNKKDLINLKKDELNTLLKEKKELHKKVKEELKSLDKYYNKLDILEKKLKDDEVKEELKKRIKSQLPKNKTALLDRLSNLEDEGNWLFLALKARDKDFIKLYLEIEKDIKIVVTDIKELKSIENNLTKIDKVFHFLENLEEKEMLLQKDINSYEDFILKVTSIKELLNEEVKFKNTKEFSKIKLDFLTLKSNLKNLKKDTKLKEKELKKREIEAKKVIEEKKRKEELTKKAHNYSKTIQTKETDKLKESFYLLKETLKDDLSKLKLKEQNLTTQKRKLKELFIKYKRVIEPFLETKTNLKIKKVLYDEAGINLDLIIKENKNEIEIKDISDLKYYEKTLAIQNEALKQKKEKKELLEKKIETIDKVLNSFIQNLYKINEVENKYYYTAIELKERVKNGNIKDNINLSLDIIKALDMTPIYNIENQIKEEESFLNSLKIDSKELNSTNSFAKDTYKNRDEVYSIVGTNLDKLSKLEKLQIAFKDNNLSNIEKESQKQEAIRELKNQNGTFETILSFVDNDEISTTNELILKFYIDLNKLKAKKENLKEQKEIINELIELINKEKNIIPKLISLLNNSLEETKKLKDKKWESVKNRLKNISSKEKQREYIEKETLNLSLIDAKIKQTKTWIEFFTKRNSKEGLDKNNLSFQEKLGVIGAKENTINREIKRIDEPKTGDIALLRKDKVDAIKEASIGIIIEIIFIFITVLMLSKILSYQLNRLLENDKDSPLLLLAKNSFKIILWLIATILILDILGFNVTAILAGLGIGGLALAFAIQNTIEDIFSGLTLMMLKPFKVGDKVFINDDLCVIETIGLRYTIVKDFIKEYKHIVPNSHFTNTIIINVSTHLGAIVGQTIQLAGSNSAQKIELAIEEIRKIIDNNPKSEVDFIKHNGFEDYSSEIKYVFNVIEFKDRHNVQTQIHLDILKRLQELDIEVEPPFVKELFN